MALLECMPLEVRTDKPFQCCTARPKTIGTRKVVMLILLRVSKGDYGMLSSFVVMAVATYTKGVTNSAKLTNPVNDSEIQLRRIRH